MGQAKQRGTFEERVAQAVVRQNIITSPVNHSTENSSDRFAQHRRRGPALAGAGRGYRMALIAAMLGTI